MYRPAWPQVKIAQAEEIDVSYLEVEHVGTLEAHDFWRLEEVPGEREEELHAHQRRPHQEEPVLARHPGVATAPASSAGVEAAGFHSGSV